MKPASVERVERIGPLRTLAPGVRNRFVVEPTNLDRTSPFILLVEDFIQPGTDFHQHPHRGLETVTFVLSGALSHRDHLGTVGISNAGDVQWMTAGRGIEHGGCPVGGPVHALQLWLALPEGLRESEPGTREQRRSAAMVRDVDGGTVATYGTPSGPEGKPWSVRPMTLTDVSLESPGSADVEIAPGDRAFLYVIEGPVMFGGHSFLAGDVVWLKEGIHPSRVFLEAQNAARVVIYAGAPLNEHVIVAGPFAGGSVAELEQVFADFRTKRLP